MFQYYDISHGDSTELSYFSLAFRRVIYLFMSVGRDAACHAATLLLIETARQLLVSVTSLPGHTVINVALCWTH